MVLPKRRGMVDEGMGSPTFLMLTVILSSFGMGYFIYGKKQQRFLTMLAGAALCGVPYFIANVYVLAVVGGLLLAVPFVSSE